MSGTRHLTADELPPRPDPKTGLPRPRVKTYELTDLRIDHPNSPALDDAKETRWPRRVAGTIALFFLGYTVIQKGIGWLFQPEHLDVWAVLAGVFVVFYWFFRRDRLSAGADWVARGKRWVRLYELTKVTSHSYPYWGTGLCLRDSGGRKLRYKFADLSSDRLLWDLTYNGMLHSVIAGGAKTNWQAHKTLDLPQPRPAEPGHQ